MKEDSSDLIAAAKVWDDPNESLESVIARIHDGLPADALVKRADCYVGQMIELFKYAPLPPDGVVMEIGGGVGFIMEAMARAAESQGINLRTIIDLDIASNMIENARRRLGDRRNFEYLHYDGITVPLPDSSLDMIYSVSSLHHVPKPYVYNLFLEARRLLRPAGHLIVHLLSFKMLPVQEGLFPWRDEIHRQVHKETSHWHHFYSVEELESVLSVSGFQHVDVREQEGTITFLARPEKLALPRDFDKAKYLALNPDVATAKADPGDHWLRFGHREGRKWT